MKYIYISLLLISFIVGILYFYLTEQEKKIIYISPNPDNCEKNTYKDMEGTCYKYESREVSCDNIQE